MSPVQMQTYPLHFILIYNVLLHTLVGNALLKGMSTLVNAMTNLKFNKILLYIFFSQNTFASIGRDRQYN